MKSLLFYIFSLGFIFNASAQESPINVLFVVDASSSMLKKWGKDDKWSIAERSLLRMADSLMVMYDNLHFGLRVYGHQSLPITNDCFDSELKLPIGKHSIATLKDRLISVAPKGITPLAYTLQQTEQDFAGFEGQKNILVVITDGSESCLGDPCEILDILLKNEVIIKPVIIGLDIDVQSLQDYHCLKEIYNPHFPFDFEQKILQVVTQAINFTTLQIDLLDENDQSTQRNIPMLFYNQNKEVAYSFYHKRDGNGNPDTLLVNPSVVYDIHIETLPALWMSQVKLKNNEHNILKINAPTCTLSIIAANQNERVELIPNIPYLIKKAGETEYFHIGELNNSQDYLHGVYDIDILTLPVTRLSQISLNQNEVKIPIKAPGKLVVNAPFPMHAALFQEINTELVNIYTFPANSRQEILDLQPGKYSLYYRFDHKHEMVATQVKTFEIQSQKTVELKL